MRSVTVRLDDLRTTILNLGFVGENEHKTIRFDSKKMFEEYPDAAASLTVVPPAGEAYPAIIERDGDIVAWTITDSDLTAEGDGEIQLAFTSGEVVAKTYIGKTRTCRALVPTGEIPSGLDDFLTRAGAALTAIPETIDEALAEAKASGEFDGPAGPAGQDGAPGRDGTDGADGFSPTATVTKSGKVATITITDKNGTTTATVSDGEGGDPTSIIDDTAGSGDTDKVWSADKSSALLTEITNKYEKPTGGIPSSDMTDAVQSSLSAADSAYQKPQTGIPASDLASGVIPAVHNVPSGGTTGQVLKKSSGTDYEMAWADASPVETVTGSTPSITGVSGTRYICGECATLSITAPASGCIDVVFESGSTATVLTVTSAKTGVTAIKWANGFDPSSLESNTTYEINILDGEFGVVGSWT